MGDDDRRDRDGDDVQVVEIEDVDRSAGTFTSTRVVTGDCPQRQCMLYRVDGPRLLRVAAYTVLADDGNEPQPLMDPVTATVTPPVIELDLTSAPGSRHVQRWRLDSEFVPGEWETTVRYAGPSTCTDASGRRHRVVRVRVEERCTDNGSTSNVDTWFSPELGIPIESVSRTVWHEGDGIEFTASTKATLARLPE